MSDYEPTIKIRRPPKIQTDDRGRTVWVDPVDTAEELELVSTQALRVLIDANDKKTREAIEDAVSGASDGVLARDPAAGTFEIIADADLQAILDTTDDLSAIRRPADATPVLTREDTGDELSLVSTQALRKLLGKEPQKPGKPPKKRDPSGGFDPYNSG